MNINKCWGEDSFLCDPVTAAVAGGVQIGGTVYAADQQKEAAETQAKAALEASRTSSETQLQMFREGQEATAPWRERGQQALDELAALQGFEGGEAQDAARDRFRTSPGYEFQLAEASRASDRAAAARGGFESGSQIRRLQDIAQGTADMQYGSYVSQLQATAGVGQASASQTASQSTAVGQSVGQVQAGGIQQAGAAQAQGQIAQAQIWAGAVQQGAQLYGMYQGGYFGG